MTEEALIFICDESACKANPFFYDIFPMDDRWEIIRSILKAVETAALSSPQHELCPDWRTCKCKDGCAHSSHHSNTEAG